MRNYAGLFFKTSIPIIRAHSFERLKHITFLGVLSPNFKELTRFPIKFKNDSGCSDDETRAHHSIAVAHLTAKTIAKLELSERTYRYAVAWGLLHDIATWPLSHTGEAAFSAVTDVNGSKLREMMITGSRKLSQSQLLHLPIKEAGLDHDTLLALLDKAPQNFSTDMNLLHKIIHSPITPDTLEGMHRSGKVYGINVDNPGFIIDIFEKDLLQEIVIKSHASTKIRSFWNSKASIYKRIINDCASIEFESIWSESIADTFRKLSLQETLELSEKTILDRVSSQLMPRFSHVRRYKAPLEYAISDRYSRKPLFLGKLPIDALNKYLVKRNLEF